MGSGLTAPPPADEAFYARPVLAVARDLLGATIRHGPVCVRVSEVEAYGGLDDPASHASRGPTPRAAVMFGPPGRAYVYFIYGMHWCLNVVCEPAGTAAAVLVRAGEVVDGLEAARARAPRLPDRDLARGPGRLARALGVDGSLTGTPVTGDGPVVVTPAPVRADGGGCGLVLGAAAAGVVPVTSVGAGGPEVGGLVRAGGPEAVAAGEHGMASAEPVLGQLPGAPPVGPVILSGPRIGVRAAHDRPWRLWIAGDPTVSGPGTARAARRSGS